MKERRVVIFAAGFLLAAALGGIFALVEAITPKSGDDDRVVVAGGSLVIGSKFGFKTDATNNYLAIHKHERRTVQGGVLIIDGQPLPPDSWIDGPIKFEIAYCAGNCDPNTPDDLITIMTDQNAKRLRAFNSNPNHKLGDEAAAAPDPKKINHLPEAWKVKRIRDVLNNKDYPCATGLCSVVPIYHCSEWFGNCQ